MAFGQNVGKAGGKTRKIRPSGSDLCSFRDVAGRSVQDCGKVVQKLAGREDENHKLCTTLCAPLRHGTRIVQVSFPRCVRCVGVVVRRCAIRSFSLPPAEAGCPFRRRGRGGRRASAGHCARGLGDRRASAGHYARGRPPLPSPSPTLRSALRPSAGKVHGRRQAGAGRTHSATPISGRRHGRRQAVAGRTHGQERGLPCALPPLRTMIRHTNGRGRGRRRADAGRTHGATPISGRGRGRRRADAGRTHGTSPISGRRHGRRQAVAGRTHGQERGLPCALPPLRSALRPSAGRGAAVDKLTRGERTGRSGDSLVHFRLCTQ